MTAQEIEKIYAAENGIIYMFGNTRLTFPVMLTIVIGTGILFFIVGSILMTKYRKK